MRATAIPGVAPRVSAPFPRGSSALTFAQALLAARSAGSAERSRGALSCARNGRAEPGCLAVQRGHRRGDGRRGKAPGGWARAIAPASPRAR